MASPVCREGVRAPVPIEACHRGTMKPRPLHPSRETAVEADALRRSGIESATLWICLCLSTTIREKSRNRLRPRRRMSTVGNYFLQRKDTTTRFPLTSDCPTQPQTSLPTRRHPTPVHQGHQQGQRKTRSRRSRRIRNQSARPSAREVSPDSPKQKITHGNNMLGTWMPILWLMFSLR